MQIEQDAESVHENHVQQAIAQMPQILRSDSFSTTEIGQLPKGRIDAIAHPIQYGTPTVRRLGTGFAEGGQQGHVQLAQGLLELREPLVAISQQQTGCSCGPPPDYLALMHVGRSQAHLGNRPWPTHTHLQSKAVKDLPIGMIFLKAGRDIKAMAGIGVRKLPDGNRHTISNGHRRVIQQEAITDHAPQPFFHRPQVGGLKHKGRAVHLRHRREIVRRVAVEEVDYLLVLGLSQVACDQFHDDPLTIDQFRHRPTFTQAFSWHYHGQRFVKRTEACDHKVVRVHGAPPQKPAILLRQVDSMSLSFGKKTCTSG